MFSPDDFTDEETVQMLSVIVMTQIGKPPMTNFHKMLTKDKKNFNVVLNNYIQSFPEVNWKEELTTSFHNILSEEIFNEDFKPTTYEPFHIGKI